MSGLSKDRVNALQQAARSLLEERQIDVWQPYDFRRLAYDLSVANECHIETAKRHLARAARRMRGEQVPARGGPRPGAGRPRKEGTEMNEAARKIVAREARVAAQRMIGRLQVGANEDALYSEAWHEALRLNPEFGAWNAEKYFEQVFYGELEAE